MHFTLPLQFDFLSMEYYFCTLLGQTFSSFSLNKKCREILIWSAFLAFFSSHRFEYWWWFQTPEKEPHRDCAGSKPTTEIGPRENTQQPVDGCTFRLVIAGCVCIAVYPSSHQLFLYGSSFYFCSMIVKHSADQNLEHFFLFLKGAWFDMWEQQYTLNAGILRVSYEFGVLEYFMLYAADHTFFIGWFFHVKAIKYCVPDLDMGSMDLSTFCLPWTI